MISSARAMVNACISRSAVLFVITRYNVCAGIMDYHKLIQSVLEQLFCMTVINKTKLFIQLYVGIQANNLVNHQMQAMYGFAVFFFIPDFFRQK